MSGTSGVQAIVRSASRRRLLALALEQGALPCAVALTGAAILLLAGSDILNWFWPALLAGAAVAYAAFRIRRRMLSPYRVAQLIDQRLGLHDSLATAWFLLSQNKESRSAVAVFQVEQAEQLASSIQPASALPLKATRRWLPAAALLILSLSLFTVRYAKNETLSLRPPLVSVQVPALFGVERLFSPHSKFLLARRSNRSKAAGETGEASDPQSSGASSSNTSSTAGVANGAKPSANRNRRASGTASSASAARPDTLPPSLFRRVKDALASLGANLRSSLAGKQSPQANERQSAQTVPGASSASNRQAGGHLASQGQPKAARQQGATLSSAQGPSTKSTQALSGIGHHNGDKALRQAEDLAAMGKLTEILGKRSAGLTGDMTVQSVAGTTALQTPDTGRVARHEDPGGEIRRDEVPPLYRDYVERYMEQIRQNAASR